MIGPSTVPMADPDVDHSEVFPEDSEESAASHSDADSANDSKPCSADQQQPQDSFPNLAAFVKERTAAELDKIFANRFTMASDLYAEVSSGFPDSIVVYPWASRPKRIADVMAVAVRMMKSRKENDGEARIIGEDPVITGVEVATGVVEGTVGGEVVVMIEIGEDVVADGRGVMVKMGIAEEGGEERRRGEIRTAIQAIGEISRAMVTKAIAVMFLMRMGANVNFAEQKNERYSRMGMVPTKKIIEMINVELVASRISVIQLSRRWEVFIQFDNMQFVSVYLFIYFL
ncbi:hypothetical protein Tcan_13561 [Toxocara canis]|uniref:Uncharacterized protein n=1 Tax=Toxocara canis TaxID=6265 RepID=A0A0B2VSD7_TOXCA|nr:hypothetical protein Tcan_13561 [Toxocara canis]